MSTCTSITAGITRNCDDKMVTGLQDEVMLINIDDIDKDASTFDATNPLIVTAITLKTTSPAASGYKIEGINFSNEHNTALVKRRFINGWDHNLMFRVFDNTPDTKKFVKEAVDARFVAIIKNRYSNRNAATNAGVTIYEVLGWEYGLEITEATRDTMDEESSGGWVLQAACDETVKEPQLPYTFWVTDEATTELAFQAFD